MRILIFFSQHFSVLHKLTYFCLSPFFKYGQAPSSGVAQYGGVGDKYQQPIEYQNQQPQSAVSSHSAAPNPGRYTDLGYAAKPFKVRLAGIYVSKMSFNMLLLVAIICRT